MPPVPRRTAKPIVYYGTSIVQGVGVSRPGRALPAILGRQLERPVINLGFSGLGKMEVALANLLSEIDAAAYVVDCLPNLDAVLITSRAGPFVQALRAARPTTPIILVEDRTYANAWTRPDLAERNADSHRCRPGALCGLRPRCHRSPSEQLAEVNGARRAG